jgi:mannose-1-phosphate guanylyltransferase/phosphomannomutase
MKAIIVAGGQGTRLRPLTETIPKPMVQIAGIPILEYIIRNFKKHNITDIVLALCYLPQPIIDYFGDGSKFGVSVTYTFEDQNTPLGTAGAILPAKKYIDETFIVTYADTLRDLDITKMISEHRQSGSIVTIKTYKHTGENFKSSLVFTDTTLTAFTELPTSTTLTDAFVWSNGSLYILEPEIFSYINENGSTDFAKDVFQRLLKEGKRISVFPYEGYFIDIGTFKTLKQAEDDIKNKKFIP